MGEAAVDNDWGKRRIDGSCFIEELRRPFYIPIAVLLHALLRPRSRLKRVAASRPKRQRSEGELEEDTGLTHDGVDATNPDQLWASVSCSDLYFFVGIRAFGHPLTDFKRLLATVACGHLTAV